MSMPKRLPSPLQNRMAKCAAWESLPIARRTIANRAESIRKMVKKLGAVEQLKAGYEAGPTGYVLYWQLAELGVLCKVIAATLAPMKAGDRVKTDRRDAERLARSFRSGDLTAVWVPDEGSEALRDLVRVREAARQDRLRARHRLNKFLLRAGQRPAAGVKAWTQIYMAWVRRARIRERSSPPWGASCWASSGLSELRQRRRPSSQWRPDKKAKAKARTKTKAKTFPRMKKQKRFDA
jgi:transposase